MHSVEWLESIIRTKDSRIKTIHLQKQKCGTRVTVQRWQKHFENGEVIHAIIKY